MRKANIINKRNAIQNAVQSILVSFCTGSGISFLSKCIYPYGTHYSPSIKKSVQHVLENSGIYQESAEKQNVMAAGNILVSKSDVSSQDIAGFLSLYYGLLNKEKIINAKKDILDIREVVLADYTKDSEYLQVLTTLKQQGEYLQKNMFGKLVLFGSLATKDYVKGHSDLDTLFIISKETCMNPEKLLLLRKHIANIMKELYFIDPLQHHGPFMFTEFDLESFPEQYLPLEAWKKSLSLCENITVTIHRRDAKKEMKEQLQKYKAAFEKILLTKNKKKSMYTVKFQYQVILLFPSVYLMAKGNPCYKGESFKLIKEYLKSDGNALLGELSRIRYGNLFQTSAAGPFVQKIYRLIPHPFMYASLYRIFHKDVYFPNVEKLLEPGLKNMMQVIEDANHG